MTKTNIVKLSEFAIALQGMRQDLIHLQEQEQESFDEMPDVYENSVIREIMLEDIESLDNVIEGVDTALDDIRAILRNNK